MASLWLVSATVPGRAIVCAKGALSRQQKLQNTPWRARDVDMAVWSYKMHSRL